MINFLYPKDILLLKDKFDTDYTIIEKLKSIAKKMPKSNIKLKNLNKTKKWNLKTFLNDDDKIKKEINSLLNKYTNENYKTITLQVLNLDISNVNLLNHLSNQIFNKYLNENQYYKHWNFLIKNIIFNNKKWKFNNISFIEIMYDNIQNYFECLINDNFYEKMEKLKIDEIKLFYKLKKKIWDFVYYSFIYLKINF